MATYVSDETLNYTYVSDETLNYAYVSDETLNYDAGDSWPPTVRRDVKVR